MVLLNKRSRDYLSACDIMATTPLDQSLSATLRHKRDSVASLGDASRVNNAERQQRYGGKKRN